MSESSGIGTRRSADETQVEIDRANTMVSVVGLGYDGLPLAVEFDSKEFVVIDYDVDDWSRLRGGQTIDRGHPDITEWDNWRLQ